MTEEPLRSGGDRDEAVASRDAREPVRHDERLVHLLPRSLSRSEVRKEEVIKNGLGHARYRKRLHLQQLQRRHHVRGSKPVLKRQHGEPTVAEQRRHQELAPVEGVSRPDDGVQAPVSKLFGVRAPCHTLDDDRRERVRGLHGCSDRSRQLGRAPRRENRQST